ncbi:MAG: VOC family protein [Anaerolineaceae bacterium]|nr:VOC family protein [Anaerolineaceae bacterium]
MAQVKGIGGVFFKANDPAKLRAWYQANLGIIPETEGHVSFWWKQVESPEDQYTVWSPFPQDTPYFEPSNAPFMINYIVDDLDGLLAELRAKGVPVDDHVEEMEYGRFGWATDPEGNRFELWQPSNQTPI